MTIDQKLVDAYQAQEISLVDFIGEILIEPEETDHSFSWGSCQYNTACDMFELMDRLQRNGYDPFEVLKIDDFDRPTPDVTDVVEKFTTSVSKHIEECYPEEKYQEIREERLGQLEKVRLETTTLNSVFESARNNSWDLWTISLTLCEWLYGKEYEDYLNEAIEKSPGVGPVLNVLVQSQNYVVGAVCYRLYVDGLVTDPHTTYNGFDT